MVMLKRILIVGVLWLLPLVVWSQTSRVDVALEEYMEIYVQQTEYSADENEVLEILNFYLENKINVNDTTSKELLNLFFVQEKHLNAIRAYVQQQGQMLSLSELTFISVIDSVTLQLLYPFVVAEPVEDGKSVAIKDMLTLGKHTVVLGTKTTLEIKKGYIDSSYLGDSFRYYFRYNYKYKDNLFFSFSGDKDAGEELFGQSQKLGFDHYGVTFMLKNVGRVQKLAVGNYNIQLGQGLTMWTGSGMKFTVDGNIKKYAPVVKAVSPFAEHDFLKGGALQVALGKHTSMAAFVSYKKRDATNMTVANNGQNVFQSFYTSGYHRTEKELQKKDLVGETVTGGSLQYNNTNFTLGINGYYQHLDAILSPKEYFYNCYYFSGSNNMSVGVDASYLFRNILLFAESAFDGEGKNASIAGAQLWAGNDVSLSVYYRNYGKDYQNMYSNGLGQNSDSRNENGLAAVFNFKLPWDIRVVASADVFEMPWLRYQVYSPTNGMDCRLKLTKNIFKHTSLVVQYRCKESTANASSEQNHVPITEQTLLQQLQLKINYLPDSRWSFSTRAIYSRFTPAMVGNTGGVLVYQEVCYHSDRRPLSLVARCAYFNIADYDARIYTYERDLLYEFSTPAFYGKGIRMYLLMDWEVAKNLRLALRYSISYYPENVTIGSGLEMIDANHKQEIKLQLRYGF